MSDAEKRYVFGQQNEGERERLGVIERYLDPMSRRWLEERGVAEGWRCLDVGAGGGSLTRWLCRRVAPSGRVVAVDLDTRFLEQLDEPNLEVRVLDVFSDAFPRDAFDLVHSRYVLEHLAERETALRQLVRAARPGGWVVVTDCGGAPPRTTQPSELFDRVGLAFLETVAKAGWDFGWAPRMAEAMRTLGLEDVGAEAVRHFETGTDEGVTGIMRGSFLHLRDAIAAGGRVSAEELGEALAMIQDPKRGFLSWETWTAWGRRPA